MRWRSNDRQALRVDLEAADWLPTATRRRDLRRDRHRTHQSLLDTGSHHRRSTGRAGRSHRRDTPMVADPQHLLAGQEGDRDG